MIWHPDTEDEKAALLEYLTLKIGASKENLVGSMPYRIIAIVKNGEGVGAVLFTNFRSTSVEVALAGDPGWINLGDLRAVLRHVFDDLGVMRAWGIIKRSNSASRQLAARMGCREVGILENEYGPGADGVLYSMTRDKCRWLKR